MYKSLYQHTINNVSTSLINTNISVYFGLSIDELVDHQNIFSKPHNENKDNRNRFRLILLTKF